MAPSGLKDVVYDLNKTKNEFLPDGCKTEKIGVAPSRIIKIDKIFKQNDDNMAENITLLQPFMQVWVIL